MKYRLTALILVLSLTLVSCSLAEDITPPPDFQTSTAVQAQPSVTPTPPGTNTSEPATQIPVTTPISQPTNNKETDSSINPGKNLGNVSGNLINGSSSKIPDVQKVTLYGFDKDTSGSYQKTMEAEGPVDGKGNYEFKGVEILQGRAFLIVTSWGGIEYQSDPLIITDNTLDLSLPVTIFEKTEDLSLLSFNQVHLIFELSSESVIHVTGLFIVSNLSNKAVEVSSDGTSIPFIQTPENAGNLQFQLSQGSAPLLNSTNGFAMAPGTDKQYGFIADYSVPYNKRINFKQLFSMPVSSLTVFIPLGMRLKSEQLTQAGQQSIQSQSYNMYQANKMASGSTLSLTISGKPGTSSGFPLSKQTMILIGIGIVGVLLIGLGIFLYLRDRARLKKEMEMDIPEEDADALGEDRNSIMDAIIALDDQYKTGEISKDAYEKRRSELKDRLKTVL
jgi:hypothetical protein